MPKAMGATQEGCDQEEPQPLTPSALKDPQKVVRGVYFLPPPPDTGRWCCLSPPTSGCAPMKQHSNPGLRLVGCSQGRKDFNGHHLLALPQGKRWGEGRGGAWPVAAGQGAASSRPRGQRGISARAGLLPGAACGDAGTVELSLFPLPLGQQIPRSQITLAERGKDREREGNVYVHCGLLWRGSGVFVCACRNSHLEKSLQARTTAGLGIRVLGSDLSEARCSSTNDLNPDFHKSQLMAFWGKKSSAHRRPGDPQKCVVPRVPLAGFKGLEHVLTRRNPGSAPTHPTVSLAPVCQRLGPTWHPCMGASCPRIPSPVCSSTNILQVEGVSHSKGRLVPTGPPVRAHKLQNVWGKQQRQRPWICSGKSGRS